MNMQMIRATLMVIACATILPAYGQEADGQLQPAASTGQAAAICMARRNADDSHAEVAVAPSQRSSFEHMRYQATECPSYDRLAYRLGALCLIAEDYPVHAIPAFEKRYGLTPAALCEVGKRTAAELGIPFESEPGLPDEARRIRADIRQRARQAAASLAAGGMGQ